MRGGRTGYGHDCGAFYIDLYSVSSNIGWAVSAALSYKPVS